METKGGAKTGSLFIFIFIKKKKKTSVRESEEYDLSLRGIGGGVGVEVQDTASIPSPVCLFGSVVWTTATGRGTGWAATSMCTKVGEGGGKGGPEGGGVKRTGEVLLRGVDLWGSSGVVWEKWRGCCLCFESTHLSLDSEVS